MNSNHNACNECTIRKSTIFSDLDDRELPFIGNLIHTCTFQKKEMVFFENDPMTDIFLVKNGVIKIFKSLEDGRQQILRLCGLGDVLGLEAVFSGEYLSNAQAVTESILCKIPKKDLLAFIARKQKLALKLLQTTSKELADSRNQVFNLGARTGKERIADFLLYFYNSQCNCEATPKKINLFVTRQEISELLGIKQETVVRILGQLKAANLIRVHGREITLLKPSELAKLAL